MCEAVEALIEEALSRVALPPWQHRVMGEILRHYASRACAAVVIADEGGTVVEVDPALVRSLRAQVGTVMGWDADTARAWLVRVMSGRGALRSVREL